jgi:hypothetical protein
MVDQNLFFTILNVVKSQQFWFSSSSCQKLFHLKNILTISIFFKLKTLVNTFITLLRAVHIYPSEVIVPMVVLMGWFMEVINQGEPRDGEALPWLQRSMSVDMCNLELKCGVLYREVTWEWCLLWRFQCTMEVRGGRPFVFIGSLYLHLQGKVTWCFPLSQLVFW